MLAAAVLVWFRARHAATPAFVQDDLPTVETDCADSLPDPVATRAVAATYADAPDMSKWRTVRIFVEDKTRRPVPRATVQLKFERLLNRALRPWEQPFESDPKGLVEVKYPPDFKSRLTLHVACEAANLGGKSLYWDTPDEIPASCSVTLARTCNFSGIVVDEAGNPISGAEISLLKFALSGSGYFDQGKGEYFDFPNRRVTTDDFGRWSAQGIPLALLDRIGCWVSHPDYVGRSIDLQLGKGPRGSGFETVLRRGAILHALVLNDLGDPLPEADVEANGVSKKTDTSGKVSFGHVGKELVQFNVQAKGYQAETCSVTNGSKADELVFQMKPGQVFRGLVLNEAEEPLVFANVSVGSWGSAGQRPTFSSHTDSAGRFEWETAPASPQVFRIWKEGYSILSDLALKPWVENVVTLKKLPQIQGWVVNAKTGEPAKEFRIALGDSSKADPFRWASKSFASPVGKFVYEGVPEGSDLIRAESEEYKEQIQRFSANQSNELIVLRLEPVPVLRGLVVSSEGAPMAGVQVRRARKLGPATGFNRSRLFGQGQQIVTTDAAGQFSLAYLSSGLLLAASHDGFGQSTGSEVEAGKPIVLQRYGRIQGRLTEGRRPAARQWVSFRTKIQGLELDRFVYCERADEDGDFTLTMIPPGEGVLEAIGRDPESSNALSDEVPVTIRPGQTTQVEVDY